MSRWWFYAGSRVPSVRAHAARHRRRRRLRPHRPPRRSSSQVTHRLITFPPERLAEIVASQRLRWCCSSSRSIGTRTVTQPRASARCSEKDGQAPDGLAWSYCQHAKYGAAPSGQPRAARSVPRDPGSQLEARGTRLPGPPSGGTGGWAHSPTSPGSSDRRCAEAGRSGVARLGSQSRMNSEALTDRRSGVSLMPRRWPVRSCQGRPWTIKGFLRLLAPQRHGTTANRAVARERSTPRPRQAERSGDRRPRSSATSTAFMQGKPSLTQPPEAPQARIVADRRDRALGFAVVIAPANRGVEGLVVERDHCRSTCDGCRGAARASERSGVTALHAGIGRGSREHGTRRPPCPARRERVGDRPARGIVSAIADWIPARAQEPCARVVRAPSERKPTSAGEEKSAPPGNVRLHVGVVDWCYRDRSRERPFGTPSTTLASTPAFHAERCRRGRAKALEAAGGGALTPP